MKLSDFIKLNNPIEYNFEFENKLLAESGLDTYSRYFTYKANNDKARNSGYENGKYLITSLCLYTICYSHKISMNDILKK